LSQGAWRDETIGGCLAATAKREPSKPAYICGESSISFGELDAAAEHAALGLSALGLCAGERALFQMGTVIETAIAVFACVKAGLVPVCAIPQYRDAEIGALAELAAPSVYFVQADLGRGGELLEFAQRMSRKHAVRHLITARGKADACLSLDELVARGAEEARRGRLIQESANCLDVAVLQLSGGSTGVPKIIPRHHGEYLGHTKQWCDCYDTTSASTAIWALPLLHNAGMMFGLVRSAVYGATTVLMPQWDPSEYFSLIAAHSVAHAFTIGPHVSSIASFATSSPIRSDGLDFFFTLQGAEAIEAATGVKSTNMFGITEGLVLTSAPSDGARLRHATVGYVCSPFDEVRVKVPGSDLEVLPGQVGELCFRGPSSLKGYYRAPQPTAAALTKDGFFRTADLVRAIPVDGRLAYEFHGRLRDNINRGGEKFGTEDIERVLLKHPAILDAKVVAMPDPVFGEKACAFVIPAKGMVAPSVSELAQFVVSHGLAKFKCPERIELIDAFPVTRVGKLDRARLRELIAEKMGAKIGGAEEA
jgi:non-ribosomal peptide synthetase component E (peptide arylation enzyme)